eukprot:CAMPEP_0116851098 /NCGR_PEP_ID=MMETSP0418-20121206/16523_1 /TAXON_ID=1158023 /ORGANISM="Astrosyne radiata, Strain 13vi08-1A" /LENGTH=314 /DNA_ID=CAMNT_0004483061 /DNA_START=170 /DNA_END=1110 /DNA_ORIENTATION=+
MASYPPSKVDLIKLRRSFVSIHLTIGKQEGVKEKIEIIESSVGMSVAIDAGTKVVRSTVRPLAHVQEDLYDDRVSNPAPYPLWKWVVRDACYLIEMVVVTWTFIPLYEVILALMNASLYVQIVGVMFGILLQCVVWTCCLRVFQFACYSLPDTPHRVPLLHTLSTYEYSCQVWSLWFLLWGTPFFGKLLQLFGSEVEGRLLFLGEFAQDFLFLSFADETIVDNTIVTGHHQMYSTMTLQPTRVGGVVHASSRLLGGACVARNQEHGPFKFSASTTRNGQDGGSKTMGDISQTGDETAVDIPQSNGSTTGGCEDA